MSGAIFTLATSLYQAGELVVVAFEADESLNEPYCFCIDLKTPLAMAHLGQAESELLGQAATFVVRHSAEPPRVTHGVIASVEVLESVASGAGASVEGAHLRVTLLPRLALLGLRSNCRVFQSESTVAIAKKVFQEWGVAVRVELKVEPAPRSYCTQYNETDLEFVQRILADDGVSFFFDAGDVSSQGVGQETVVLFDGPWFCPAAPAANNRDEALWYRHADHPGLREITRLSAKRQLRPRVVTLADFDHQNPQLALRQSATRRELASKPPAPEDGLRVFLYRDRPELKAGEVGLVDGAAQRELERLRVDAQVVSGQAESRRLYVGHVIVVKGHPNESLNGSFVVQRLRHKGSVPEAGAAKSADEPIYRCSFDGLPSAEAIQPALRPRKVRHGLETATVVGPQGQELHCDESGRVKVQFHWDQEGQNDEKSSCWLRVSQGWAGAGWGLQFVPRVGMEVLVSFLGGDVDRPIITGSVYNATHPLPFELPEQATRSGLRSRSVGAEGFNELSFDDKAGHEQVYLHAERDWLAEVKGQHTLHVEGGQNIRVAKERHEYFAGGLRSTVAGKLEQRIGGDFDLSTTGASIQSIDGNGQLRVQGQWAQRITGKAESQYDSAFSVAMADDCYAKVQGHMVAVVGEHDARKSLAVHVEGSLSAYASGKQELSSDKRLSLVCGDSRLVLRPDSIEIATPTLRLAGQTMDIRSEKTVSLEAPDKISLRAPTIVAESEEAFLGLAKVAKLNGKKVKINCTNDPVDELEPSEPKPPTVIELRDKEGQPMVKRRFRLVLPDGSEVGGCTDEEGRAQLEVEASGEIEFLDVADPQED